jgi:hypothetical protein
MDWKLAFITALLMALATILIRAVLGKKVAWVVGVIVGLSVLLPLLLIIGLGVAGMLKAEPGSMGKASSETIAAIYNYMVENLPGLIISAVAGAIVGFLVTLIKKVTPRKMRSKVKRAIRL